MAFLVKYRNERLLSPIVEGWNAEFTLFETKHAIKNFKPDFNLKSAFHDILLEVPCESWFMMQS